MLATLHSALQEMYRSVDVYDADVYLKTDQMKCHSFREGRSVVHGWMIMFVAVLYRDHLDPLDLQEGKDTSDSQGLWDHLELVG